MYLLVESPVCDIIGQLHQLQVAMTTNINILRDVLNSNMNCTVSRSCDYTSKTLLVKVLPMAVHTHNVSYPEKNK